MLATLATILGYDTIPLRENWWWPLWIAAVGAPWLAGIALLWSRYRRVLRDDGVQAPKIGLGH